MATATYNPLTTTYTAPAGSGLGGQAAAQNLAAGPQLDQLSQMINAINQANNQARVPGGAALERQSSANIQNELAGLLSPDYLQNLQSTIAQRGATGGFGVDSANTNAAALRAMGLQSQQLQQQGQTDLTAAYNRAAPLWDVSQGMVTPGLLETQQQNQTQNALQAKAQENQQAQWQAQLAEQAKEYQGTLAQKQQEVSAQYGLAYAQLNQAQKQFVDSQAQQAAQYELNQKNQMTQWGGSLAAQIAQQNQQNALEMARQNQQMQQFGLTYSQQQAQFQAQQAEAQREYDATLALNQNKMYAEYPRSIPIAQQLANIKQFQSGYNYQSPFGGNYSNGIAY